jgi:hypothetical protein
MSNRVVWNDRWWSLVKAEKARDVQAKRCAKKAKRVSRKKKGGS